MKIRGTDKDAEKIEPQMAPMIDVVFQLLIFFMLTLKIIEPEGNFSVNMPLGAPEAAPSDVVLPPLKVRLKANKDGQLVSLEFGQTKLGNDEQAFKRLNAEILQAIGGERGAQGTGYADEIEVEIDADHGLHWKHTMDAVSAVRGRLDRSVSPPRIVPYVEKIKFAAPREPGTDGGGSGGAT